MTHVNNKLAGKFGVRRIARLGSAGCLGVAVLAAGAGLQTPSPASGWMSSAIAAETAAQPRGFADIVEKVKPAVISVRVKLDAVAQTSAGEDDVMPFRQGSPFEKFFRQFGFKDIQLHRTRRGLRSFPRLCPA